MAMDNARGILYRGTSGRGAWKYQGGTWTQLDEEGLNSATISTLAYDPTGNKVYTGTIGAGVWCYDATGGTWTRIDSASGAPSELPSWYETAMAWGGDGRLYVGCWDPSAPIFTEGKGVWCYDPASAGSWTDTAGSVTAWRIISLEWGGGLLYAGCIDRTGGGEAPKGVWAYDSTSVLPDKWSDTASFLKGNCLTWDDTHDLLYAGDPNASGLFVYDPSGGGTWTDLRKVGVYGTTALAYDSGSGLVYIGQADPASTDYEGVWSYNPVADTYDPTGGSVATYNVLSLTVDSHDHCIFAGTAANGVWRDVGGTWFDTRGGATNYGISATAWDDTHGLMYAGTQGNGVWCYDPDSGDWTDTGGGVSVYTVKSLAWGGGRLYAGTADYYSGNATGVWCYDPTSETWTDVGGSISTYWVYSLVWDPSHNLLYAGTGFPEGIGDGHGVWSYDPASPGPDRWTDISAPGVSTFTITCLVQGGSRLYAGCRDPGGGEVGVWQYDLGNPYAGWSNTGGSVRTFRIYSLAWDGSGLYANCWDAGDTKGLYHYDPSSPSADKWTAIPWGIMPLRMYEIAWVFNRLYVSASSILNPPEGVWCYDPASGWYDTEGAVSALHITSFTTDGQSRLYAGSGAQGVWFATVHAPPTVVSVTPSSATSGTTATISDLKGTGFYGTPTVRLKKSGQPDITATNVSVASPSKITCRFNLAGAVTGTWDVFVQNPDGQSATRSGAFTVNPPAVVGSTWYLAEGTTAWGFSTYITIENPNPSAVKTTVTYMPTGAANKAETITLPAGSQTTLANDHLVSVMGGQSDFSTRVDCLDSTKAIAVDRTMMWTGQGAPTPEAHCSVGVTSPATTWYLPEGSSAWGFESWLLIQNPNSRTATATVTYMIEGESALTVTHQVPANSRATFNMADDIGPRDASIKVSANLPVIPERAMYKNSRREGHDSIGTTGSAQDYYLAEGSTAWGFTTYVLVQNPNDQSCDVTITYMTPSGPQPQGAFTMGGNSRKTIRVNDIPGMGNTDFSTRVHGSRPIIAERAMYWGQGTALGEACHDSIGMAVPHASFLLPDGEADASAETWTLVQNPNPSAVAVQISYLTPTGLGDVTRNETIPANSRLTFGMAGHSHITGRAAIVVTCKTAGKKIMVERSMYWNNKGAGTDTIGGYSD
jgi:hypothetical protein